MKDYLITCLGEECNEVMSELYNTDTPFITKREKQEINDLLAVADILSKDKDNNIKFKVDIEEEDEYCKEMYKGLPSKDIKKNLYEAVATLQFALFKGIRFGFENYNPKDGIKNEELININLKKIIYFCKIVSNDLIDLELWEKKKEKVIKYYNLTNKKNWNDKIAKFIIEKTTTLKTKDLNNYQITVIQSLIFILFFVIIK